MRTLLYRICSATHVFGLTIRYSIWFDVVLCWICSFARSSVGDAAIDRRSSRRAPTLDAAGMGDDVWAAAGRHGPAAGSHGTAADGRIR